MSKLARVANAMAVGIGAAMEGFGKGTMQDYMNARESYMQTLRDQRTAQMASEERTWREGESEKGREFEREMFKEKIAAETGQEERRLQNQLTIAGMRGKGGGGGGGKAGVGGITRTITDAEGTVWGVTRTGEKIDLGIKGKPGGSAPIAGVSESAYLKRARELEELQAQSEGREVDKKNILRNFKDLTSKQSVQGMSPAQKMSAIQAEIERLANPMTGGREMRGKSQEEIARIAKANVDRIEALASGEVDIAPAQDSKATAPQPQQIEAPATSTLGEKPTKATPQGAGTETSPYLADTPEQQDWVQRMAPPGSYVRVGTKVFRKKAE